MSLFVELLKRFHVHLVGTPCEGFMEVCYFKTVSDARHFIELAQGIKIQSTQGVVVASTKGVDGFSLQEGIPAIWPPETPLTDRRSIVVRANISEELRKEAEDNHFYFPFDDDDDRPPCTLCKSLVDGEDNPLCSRYYSDDYCDIGRR